MADQPGYVRDLADYIYDQLPDLQIPPARRVRGCTYATIDDRDRQRHVAERIAGLEYMTWPEWPLYRMCEPVFGVLLEYALSLEYQSVCTRNFVCEMVNEWWQ
jgi:hypothetical protein